MRVMKFGGAALRDGPAIERSLALVARAAREGRVLVVVSAQEGVTALLERAADEALRDDLAPWDALRVRHRSVLAQLGLAGELLDRHLFELRAILIELGAGGREERGSGVRADRRLRDYVLSFGERMSARVVAAVLRGMGAPAAPLDAYDLGLTTASREGEGALLRAPAPGLREALLAVPGIPVVTGFLALDAAGNLTTLGPNGSDLSAVWFGEAVGADEVILWKTVDGFLSADPDAVSAAHRIPVLGRAEAIEFAVHGADVIHAGALEPAERAGIAVRVANVLDPASPGSRIEERTPREGPLGLAHREALARYRETLALGRDQGAQLAELLAALVEAGLEPYRMTVSGHGVELLIPDTRGPERLASFAAARGTRGRMERGWASFAVIGRGVGADRELGERVLALARGAGASAEPAPGGTSASSQAFLARAEDLRTVLHAVHRELFERDPSPTELVPQPRRLAQSDPALRP